MLKEGNNFLNPENNNYNPEEILAKLKLLPEHKIVNEWIKRFDDNKNSKDFLDKSLKLIEARTRMNRGFGGIKEGDQEAYLLANNLPEHLKLKAENDLERNFSPNMKAIDFIQNYTF